MSSKSILGLTVFVTDDPGIRKNQGGECTSGFLMQNSENLTSAAYTSSVVFLLTHADC